METGCEEDTACKTDSQSLNRFNAKMGIHNHTLSQEFELDGRSINNS